MSNAEKTDWDGLAQQLMTSVHGLRAGHGAHSKDMEMRGEIIALHALHHQPEGMTPTALARACQVSTARITKTNNQLEGRGLVERHASPHDRRSVIVRLTNKGEAEVQHRFDVVNGYVAGILRELGEHDARELVRISGHLAKVVTARAQGVDGSRAGCPLEGDGTHEAR